MKVYRLAAAPYAEDLSGTGAKLYGGRWNLPGTPCLYAASSRALAALEYLVQARENKFVTLLLMVTIEADEHNLKLLTPSKLPSGWQNRVADNPAQLTGTGWLQSEKELMLGVPSSVIPEEYNYLINPEHKAFGRVAVTDTRPFVYDQRMLA